MPEMVTVAESRAYPVAPDVAYRIVAPMALPELFSRGFLAIPSIRKVEGQTGPEWGTEAGHTRTIVTSDGGTMLESLVSADGAHSFSYTITQITGPMRPLVAAVDGAWRFDRHPSGTRVTWTWRLRPQSVWTLPVVAVISLMWRGYARRALERLATELTAA